MIQAKQGDAWPEGCPPGEYAVVPVLLDEAYHVKELRAVFKI